MPSFSRLVKRNEFISLFDSRQNDNMNMPKLYLVFSQDQRYRIQTRKLDGEQINKLFHAQKHYVNNTLDIILAIKEGHFIIHSSLD